jgi:hypothetical protein
VIWISPRSDIQVRDAQPVGKDRLIVLGLELSIPNRVVI